MNIKNLLFLGRFTKSGVERVQSYLQIKQVQSKDQGFYRCRVDFFQAPTRNVKVKLSLIGKKNIIVNFCNTYVKPNVNFYVLEYKFDKYLCLKWIHMQCREHFYEFLT